MDQKMEFDQRIAAIYGFRHRNISMPTVQGSSMDPRHDEFRAMADAFLGKSYDPEKLDQIENLQTSLREKQALLRKRLEASKISADQYVDFYNELLDDTFAKCERILGTDDFLKLFGAPRSQLGGFIDKDTFLAARR